MTRLLLLVVAAVLALAGCATSTPSPAQVAPAPTAAAVPAPTRVTIPALDVQSSLIRTGLQADDSPEVPDVRQPGQASWATWSPEPGEVGPAVLLGHVDGVVDGRRGAPGVFARVDQLAAGDEVLVDRVDGTTVRFEVTRVSTWPKAEFDEPLSAAMRTAYGDTTGPELRLVTCDGLFNDRERSYVDQLIVFARAAP